MSNVSNIFSIDWFNRKSVLGTHMFGKTTFSRFLLRDESLLDELFTDNSKLSCFLTRFICSVTGSNIKVFAQDEDKSYTDGKRIVVSNLNGMEPSFTRLDTILGLTVHEASHVRFTDFNALVVSKLSSLEHWFSNVIEDEGIENCMKNKLKGWAKFLDCSKYYYFDENFSGDFSAEDELGEITKLFINVIRYPKFLVDETSCPDTLKDKYNDLFSSIYNILNKNNALIENNETETRVINTWSTIHSAKEITKLVMEYLGEDFDKQSKQNEDNLSSAMNSGNGGNSGNDMPLDLDELKEKIDKIEQEIGDISRDADKMLSDSFTKSMTDNIDTNIKRGAIKPNTTVYNKYYKWAYPFINKATKLIATKTNKLNYVHTKYNMFGQLDGACIASAFAGNKPAYKQIHERKVSSKDAARFALVLIVDISGSMSAGTVMENAGRYITLFSEAAQHIEECKLFVYTHNHNIKNVINNDYNKTKTSLGSFTKSLPYGSQNEVSAYNAIIEDVREKTNLPICCINFTDSEYCSPLDDIKSCVDRLKTEQRCVMTLVSLNERERNADNELIYGDNNYINTCSVAPEEVNRVVGELSRIIKKQYDKVI